MAKSKSEFKGEYDPGEEVAHLREEIKRLERERDKYQKEHGSLKNLFRDLLENVEAIEPPKIQYKAPAKSTVASPCVAVSHWTDWHEGAVQDADEIEGFNAFSPAILRSRLWSCVERQQEWVELHRKSYTINESVDIVTGDLLSGGIHAELLRTNEYPEAVQSVKAGELLADIIATKAQHYQKVVVEFVVVDNHARLTHKPQASEAGLNTWNYVVGAFAKERLRDVPNVEFNLYPVIQTTIDVIGRRYLICHGDRIKGWSGLPFYGFARKVGLEAVKRMKRSLGRFDRVIMGHFHTPMTLPDLWLGGSPSGTSAYDHSQGRDSDPSQSSWIVHSKHGEFDRTDWILRD